MAVRRNLPRPPVFGPLVDYRSGRAFRGFSNWLVLVWQYIADATKIGTFFQISMVDSGTGSGPTIVADRVSESPAASDNLGQFQLQGRNSAQEEIAYVQVKAIIIDPTDGSEDGRGSLYSMVDGSDAARLHWKQGIYTPGASGGDRGVDTINASAVYDDGAGPLTDYVLEHWATGKVDLLRWQDSLFAENFKRHRTAFADDIEALAAFMQENHHLPSMPSTLDAREHKQPHGQLIARLLEALEITTVHVLRLHERVKALEVKTG